MKKLLYTVFAAAGLAGLGWWAYDSQRASPGPAFEVAVTARATARPPADPAPAPRAGGPGSRGGPGGPVGVEVAQAETVALAETVSAVGTLRAAESVVLRPEIAGRIARIGFEGGARVRRGDLLVALDAAIPLAETEQTRAELELARANYQRTDDLARKQFVSERARDEAAASMQVLEARLKLAQARLSKTEIRAPFGGVLGLRNISVGDFVRDGADLVVLEDVSSMQVDLRLPERFLGQLRRGQPVQIEFDAWPGRQFKALLEAVDAQVDANGRSVIARGRLANADGALRSGMFAKASLTLSEKPGAIMIPEEAVMPTGSELFVYRIEDGKAIRTKIRTGQRRDGRVEVVEGLQPAAQVVTAGQLKIQRDGQPVRIIGAREAPAPAGG
jgi:membrane fusion protein (multidrug efflux system)